MAIRVPEDVAEWGDARGPREDEPLPTFVGRQLRAAILDGRLQPGARIRQEAIAQQYGTSRIPVREALLGLAREGLVTIKPDAGARVAQIHLADLTEVYLIREQLEPLAAALAAPRVTDEQLALLSGALEDANGPAERGDATRYFEIDRRFHFGIYSVVEMPQLVQVVEQFWNKAQRYRRLYVFLPGSFAQRLRLSQDQHRLVLDALERRDAHDAAELLEIHIRRTRLTLAAHPELFDDDAGPTRTTRRRQRIHRPVRA